MPDDHPPREDMDDDDLLLDRAFARADPAAEDPDMGDDASATAGPPSVLARLRGNGDAGSGLDEGGPSDRYEVLHKVGEGGVGVVFRAHDRDLGREVALKFLRAGRDDDPAVLQRFVQEAQLGGQLQHPGIAPVYELGLGAGARPFFAMKLVRGETLLERLGRRSDIAADRGELLALFQRVAEAVGYAHSQGVVHRDLKPGNVMIGAFGELQVVDWGLGKVLRGAAANPEAEAPSADGAERVMPVATPRSKSAAPRSLDGAVMGTPAYMAPEQARGDVDRIDARTDVFALGAILCEVLTGAPPYRGSAEQCLLQAVYGDLDDARARLRECTADPALIRICERCLCADPAERFADGGAVASAMGAVLGAAEQRLHDAAVRTAALRRTWRLTMALAVTILCGLIATAWFWREAAEQRDLADDRERGERRARAAAEANLRNFDRLATLVRLRDARETERALFPAWPERTDDLVAWIRERAQPLVESAADLETTLGSLAGPDEASRDAERSDQTVAVEFLRETLGGALRDVRSFERDVLPSVRRRLDWSRRVEEWTVDRHRARWDAASAAVNDPGGPYSAVPFTLRPQLGLIPIGANPATGLQEFVHLRSAWDAVAADVDPGELPIPRHRSDGTLDVPMDRVGIVFVLLPGGRFWMGAQAEDPDGQNYYADATDLEGPVHEVELAPFFIARHEITRWQWACLTDGERPSYYPLGYTDRGSGIEIGDGHPVTQIDWISADRRLREHGLCLPTEAQWEYATRAGRETAWWTGDHPASLQGAANILDQTGSTVGQPWPGEVWFDDGSKGATPVGRYRANAFGLHDVHGNLWEWCRDSLVFYLEAEPRPGDGYRPETDASRRRAPARIYRGGSLRSIAPYCRSGLRNRGVPTLSADMIGARAARPLR